MDKKFTTLLTDLTVGEFRDLLIEELTANVSTTAYAGCNSKPHGRLVYGLRGIQELFGCSHKTAQFYKDNVIHEAVSQNGRKIVVDADLALKLFNEQRDK